MKKNVRITFCEDELWRVIEALDLYASNVSEKLNDNLSDVFLRRYLCCFGFSIRSLRSRLFEFTFKFNPNQIEQDVSE